MQNRPQVHIHNISTKGFKTGISVPDTVDLNVHDAEFEGTETAVEIRGTFAQFPELAGLPLRDVALAIEMLSKAKQPSVREAEKQLAKTPLWERMLSSGANVAKIVEVLYRLSQDPNLVAVAHKVINAAS